MNLGNLNVASRLLLGFAIPLAFFIAFGIWLLTAMTHISSNALQIKTETVPFALKAKTMEKDVIQVQQWLTDISATRAQDGLNDGFTQAEASRNSFLASLDEYEKMFSAKGDQTSLNKVQTIRSDFENYYKVGLKMAHGYIDGGPSEGNKLMAQFDKTSQSLQDVLGPFIQSQVSEMELNIDAVENDATTAKRTALILLVLVVGVSVLLARFISLSITRPLNIMQSVVSEVELNSDFTKRIELNQTDEVGKTAAAFNRLLDTMRNIIQQNRTAINQISDSAQGLSNSVEKVTQSAGLQSEAATTVAASTEEISVTISEISSSAADSGSVATQEQRHTEHALKLTEDSMQGINSTAQSIKDSAISVSRLSESSTQINNIVVVIKEIADQTNLLALNAAIEAARAGEQGRGFAVVADEVRKLAERTSNSTGEIESLIGSIQKEIEIAVQKMSGADAQATRSVDSAQAVKTALEEIGGEGNLLELRMKDVTSSIVECDSAIREIARQMEKIAQMTEEGSVAATYTRDTAQVLNNLARNLRLSIERFKV